jgi:alpha-amylase
MWKDWASDVSHENGNYDYLSAPSHPVSAYRASSLTRSVGADIEHKHPEVISDLFNWGPWILSTLGDGAAGFRFDAIKHISRNFTATFVEHVRQETGFATSFAVGEFWNSHVDDIDQYLNDFGTQVRQIWRSVLQ